MNYCPVHGEYGKLTKCPQCVACIHTFVHIYAFIFGRTRRTEKYCIKCGESKILRVDKFKEKI